MKKIFILLTAVFSAALFSSCGFIDFSKDDGSITAPTITYGSDGGSIIITPVHQSGCYYVNVIRYEVSTGDKDADMVPGSTVNIGQIQPTEYYNNHAMTFIDYYTDSNKFYQYYVRYRKADGYTSSQTTISYQGKGTAGSGSRVFEVKGQKLAVINVLGRVFMPPVDSPWQVVKEEIDKLNKE